MSFDPEDPKWSAYVLGELDDDARAAIDSELARSPDAQRFVDELRRTIDLISTELQAEPCPSMSNEELAPVGTAGEVTDEEVDPKRPLFHTIRPEGHRRMVGRGVILALAASLLAGIGIGSYLVAPGNWHIRDLKLAWKSKSQPTEAFHQAESDGDVLLEDSSVIDGRSSEAPFDYFKADPQPQDGLADLTTDTLVLDTPTLADPNNDDPFEEAGGGMGNADISFGGGAGFEYRGRGMVRNGSGEKGNADRKLSRNERESQLHTKTYAWRDRRGDKNEKAEVEREQSRATPRERRRIEAALGSRNRDLGEKSKDVRSADGSLDIDRASIPFDEKAPYGRPGNKPAEPSKTATAATDPAKPTKVTELESKDARFGLAVPQPAALAEEAAAAEHAPGPQGIEVQLPVLHGQEVYEPVTEWDPLESTCRHASLSIL